MLSLARCIRQRLQKREPLKGTLVDAIGTNPSNSSSLSVAKVVKELEDFSKSEEIGVYQSGRSVSELSESYQDEWQSPLKPRCCNL